MWRKLSQLLGWVLPNPSFSKQDIPNLPKWWHFGPSMFLYCQYYNYASELWYEDGSSWPELRCNPLVQASGSQELYYIRSACQLDILSAFWSAWPLVRCTPSVEASSGKEWYYFRSVWHLVSHRVRLTCLFKGKFHASSHSNSCSMSGY